MSYLILSDFKDVIQENNLLQVITNDLTVLSTSIKNAVNEAKSLIRQKFDVALEFTNTAVWDKTKVYGAWDRVYLDAALYAEASTYNIGDLTLFANNIYIANSVTTGVFATGDWDKLGAQYDLFYAIYPKPLFQMNQIYKKGDEVYWNGKTYTNLQPSVLPTHDSTLQQRIIRPQYINVFPDDPINGLLAWGVGTAYTVPASTDILNTTYWTAGDNRDSEVVQKVIDITLFHLHARIAPRNIPALRIIRYKGEEADRTLKNTGDIVYPIDSALGWFQGCARGFITPNIPLLQPDQGNRIRYGGNVKQINSY